MRSGHGRAQRMHDQRVRARIKRSREAGRIEVIRWRDLERRSHLLRNAVRAGVDPCPGEVKRGCTTSRDIDAMGWRVVAEKRLRHAFCVLHGPAAGVHQRDSRVAAQETGDSTPVLHRDADPSIAGSRVAVAVAELQLGGGASRLCGCLTRRSERHGRAGALGGTTASKGNRQRQCRQQSAHAITIGNCHAKGSRAAGPFEQIES